MYQPEYAKSQNENLALQLIMEFPLGLLLSQVQGKIQMNHLPFHFEREGAKRILLAHMARANTQWHELDNQPVWVSFRGPERYISPSHYVQKLNVPTWNYATVEIQGRITVIHEEDICATILQRSVDFFEKRNGTNWKMALPAEMRARLTKAIVGLKIEIEQIDGKFKLSQNRDPQDRKSVINFLAKSPLQADQIMRKWMELCS